MRNPTVSTSISLRRLVGVGMLATAIVGAANAETTTQIGGFDLGSMRTPLIASANVSDDGAQAPADSFAPFNFGGSGSQAFSLTTDTGSPYSGQSHFSPPFGPATPEPVTTALALSGLGIAIRRARRGR